MSICATDWSVTMDTLARDSIALTSFPLSEDPIEDSIEVKVNGYVHTGWAYDATTNALTLDTAPSEGSSIDITYAIWSDCEE